MPKSVNTGHYHCDTCKTNLMSCERCPRCGNLTQLNWIHKTRRQRVLEHMSFTPFEEYEMSGELAVIKKRRWSSSMGYSEE